jgi:outer membrane murein-binding lipoprotein Lpp
MSHKHSPVITRSTSSTSSTSKNGTLNDDILKAIEHIRLSQDKLLAGHKSLGSELKTTINALTARFDSLSLEISDLRTKVDLLESKVLALESNTSTVPSPQFSGILQEFTERDRCKLNVIMYGLPESTSSDLPTKINEDKCTVRDIFSKLSADIHTEFKSIRLGKSTSTSSRPLKIVFGTCDAASSILSSYRQAKTKNVCLLPLTSLVRDKTLLERQQLRACHLEIDRRLAAGEHNLTITFKIGSPCVISRSKNDDHAHRHPQV